jgi:ATP/maltotriose-dependent transcriptional regulator MalT
LPLTLICAPASFGKTSLITDWYEQPDTLHLPLAWLSLDEDDNDLRFLMYLTAALQTIGNIISDDTSHPCGRPSAVSKVILTILVSRMNFSPNASCSFWMIIISSLRPFVRQ